MNCKQSLKDLLFISSTFLAAASFGSLAIYDYSSKIEKENYQISKEKFDMDSYREYQDDLKYRHNSILIKGVASGLFLTFGGLYILYRKEMKKSEEEEKGNTQ